jgi:hypothetical protein
LKRRSFVAPPAHRTPYAPASMALRRAAALAALLAACAPPAVHAASRSVTINNTAPCLDNTGAILDGHDLMIRPLPDGTYVMYTNSYGLCMAPTGMGCDQTPDHCGFRNDHNVTIWTSPDLSSGSWAYVGLAFEWSARPAGILYRPDAMFNPSTGLWVLWFNLDVPGGGGVYITCTSASPFGPFADFRQSNLTVPTGGGGDFHLFLDDTAAGPPVAHAIFSSGGVHIGRLTADYRDWAPGTPIFSFDEPFSEAPAVLFRNHTFYALYGHCCCFCLQGSGLFVYTAATPLGPWVRQPATSPPGFDVACRLPPPPPPANPFCASRSVEGDFNVTLECVGGVIDALPAALYGVISGDCPAYAAAPSCDDAGFAAYAAAACIGQATCVLSTAGRPDPCLGTVKAVAAVAHCSAPPGGFSPDGPVEPPAAPANPFCAAQSVAGDFNVTLHCVNGVIDALPAAVYGVLSGASECPAYAAEPWCDDAGFAAYAAAACVGQQNCTLSTEGRPDPCLGTVKAIAAVAHCSAPPGGFSPDGPVQPPAAAAPRVEEEGASVRVSVSVSALGAVPTPGQGCLYNDPRAVSVTRSQQSAIVTVPDGLGGWTFLYYGDRWGQSPDGVKGHEPHYVFPISFNADGTIPDFTWNDTIAFNIEVAGAEEGGGGEARTGR